MAQPGSSAGHIGAHSDSPETELIVGQQITREREQQGEHHEQHTDAPIEFARLLIGTGEEDAKHVQPDGDDHQMRGPAVHIAQKLAEGDVVFEIQNIAESLHLRRMVIKH